MRQSGVRGLFAPLTIAAAVLVVLAVFPGTAVADDGDCAMCHDTLARAFSTTVHGRIQAFETLGGETGCVTCHGDGTEHMDSGGEPGTIRGFDDEVPQEEISDLCMSCHRSGSLHDWAGSTHAVNGVGCTDCHAVHLTADRAALYSQTCMSCHPEVEAEMQYPSHHPVREGHMSCDSCHAPHGSSIGLLKQDERPAELCLTCHAHLAGPFVFEHEPVAEGCDTCHMPHGSVANNLLVQNEPFLCLQCHEMHFHSGLEGEPDETGYVPIFDPDFDPDVPRDTYPGGLVPNIGPSGFRQAFATKCTQCHSQVHGSDLPSQTVPGLGQGLTR
jgi:DmsE family decaheme c-type cytochrome